MKVDYLIVGAGLAGVCFADFCWRNNKSFVVMDHGKRTSSQVAGGMFNPLVLKRFSSIWQADEQIALAHNFYPQMEELLHDSFYYKVPIYRKFASIEEQNNWFLACDYPLTAPHLNVQLKKEKIPHIDSPFLFGEVYNTGFLNVGPFINAYQRFLKTHELFLEEEFIYEDVYMESERIIYKNVEAKHLIFAEGFSMHNNPFFNFLPLDGTKGELLYVRIPNLKLQNIVKSNIFIIPLGDDMYKIGATYDWADKTDVPTQQAKEELLEGLEKLISCPYEVIDHVAGVRPTVKDRRPLVGAHYQYKNIHILNGLGTRGVLLGPYLADKLYQNIENNVPLDHNINVARYYKKLQLIK
ncbi:FAD-dependent oxidoreductase [Flavobacterium sp. CBA20B-1]|uniref:NAD(P)/FAD-dependent oxidoreductase n=1 Tax=unclassified Flavobacterium TaxID=196869 RepID=UPI0022241963|nr:MULTISPECIES: FAD-dependent oxidoreductase [unclassified Flavobacterium]WCM41614.1 FAD-dependent oxidoreductase [Flavobacterium sp. CBA20B-1]